MEGWIKLHRSIIDSAVFTDADVLKVWIWLLCNVAYDDHDVVYLGKVIPLKKGQIITGRQKLSQQTGMSEGKIYRATNIWRDKSRKDRIQRFFYLQEMHNIQNQAHV